MRTVFAPNLCKEIHCGYLADKAAEAIDLVMEQAEVLADAWTQ